MKFDENENKDTLILTMEYIGTVGNMQSDPSAFEAWALLGKAKGYKTVLLKLNNAYTIEQITKDKKVGHYNRFLYRVYCFKNIFDWFKISDELEECVKNFYNKYLNGAKLIYNVPTPTDKNYNNKTTIKISEHEMEDFFIRHSEITNEILGIEAKEYFSQLPVGLFFEKKDNNHRIFTGNKSAIDFWTVIDDTLNIIELKIGENDGVGVLSELFFYTCLMRDFHINNIAQPSEKTDIRGFNKIQNIHRIKSFILLEKPHKWLRLAYEELKKISNNDSKIEFANDIKIYDSKKYNIK